jgi:hypothetical protein
VKKYSKKGLEKRKEERKDFPEFFKHHIKFIKDNRICCEECGTRLMGDVSEVAHVLPKSYFKSISTNNLNVIYLCGWKSSINCHSLFDDGSNENIKKMLVYPKISIIFTQLKELILEKINYKVYDRYEL